ncbi:ABC transporter permease subunit [Escherichia coli]
MGGDRRRLLLGPLLSGLVNGFVIARLKINALITSLATMQIVRGLAYIISDGKAVQNLEQTVTSLATPTGLACQHYLADHCLPDCLGLLLNKTTFGRNTLAIGGNEEAARLAGVPVVRTRSVIFVLSGLVSAAAGIILAPRMTSGQPMTSIGYQLIVISACVLGGVSLERRDRLNFLRGGRHPDPGDIGNQMNLLNVFAVLAICRRGASAGGGDLRPLQTESEASRLIRPNFSV